MTEPVDIDEKRREKAAKAPRCDICGKPEHDYTGECRRIDSIEHIFPDGSSIRYYLLHFDEVVAG
jgi:hypothetical protein